MRVLAAKGRGVELGSLPSVSGCVLRGAASLGYLCQSAPPRRTAAATVKYGLASRFPQHLSLLPIHLSPGVQGMETPRGSRQVLGGVFKSKDGGCIDRCVCGLRSHGRVSVDPGQGRAGPGFGVQRAGLLAVEPSRYKADPGGGCPLVSHPLPPLMWSPSVNV